MKTQKYISHSGTVDEKLRTKFFLRSDTEVGQVNVVVR